ncbi:uncharacterized protein LOC111407304 [Olea europaea var. sylvestris]|uniref:uncharacterized protein LOC111407304 n=1 Tax=Olea europaea var. sylvestris TaxID=158386 RepID=UPI000C1D1994|nr:uncharacterized protein LOC111407304 [Olea europaea var. sylvestris]
METAFRPISYTILFCGTKNSNKLHYQVPAKYLSTSSLPSLSLTFPSKYAIDFGRKTKRRLRFNGFISASSSSFERDPSQQLAVLLEVEGVLMDVYRLGNRQAFNVAFRKLGLDCANWTEPVYLDLGRYDVLSIIHACS